MRRERFGLVASVCLTAAAMLLWIPDAWGQGSDAALRDRVQQLVERLDAPKMEAQKAAEDALVKLGPRVLPFLPEVTKSTSAGRKERLDRIRTTLREAQEESNLGASKVTIAGDGDPPDGGDPEAASPVGQCDHRPPRADGGRGD